MCPPTAPLRWKETTTICDFLGTLTADAPEPIPMGLANPERPAPSQAEPLLGNVARRLAEPRPASVRMANSQPRRLRRLRARNGGYEGLDYRRRAPLHGPARVNAAQYCASTRS